MEPSGSSGGGGRSRSGSTKAVWTLRCPGADGMLHDHFETTRFKRRRTFDVLNLSPGTYDLFVGVRRDNFFFEEKWSSQSKRSDDDTTVSTPIQDAKASLDDDSDTEIDAEEEVAKGGNVGGNDRNVLKHLRAGIGAAITGGRRVISTVTMGKVGLLAVLLDVIVTDGDGLETLSTSEQLVCGDKANFEVRFTLKDNDSCVKLRVRSMSTLHAIYVFASIFQVSEESQPQNSPPAKLQSDNVPIVEGTVQSPVHPALLEFDRPAEMLKRAFTGSRHPERSAFARALAFACFSSWCGFSVGFLGEPSVSLPLAGIALLAWVIRFTIHLVVISTPS